MSPRDDTVGNIAHYRRIMTSSVVASSALDPQSDGRVYFALSRSKPTVISLSASPSRWSRWAGRLSLQPPARECARENPAGLTAARGVFLKLPATCF